MCGVLAIVAKRPELDCSLYALNLLLRLQHRGQDGAGLTVIDAQGAFQSVRGLGLVEQALATAQTLSPSPVALGHTRYATTGTGGVAELQPFVQGQPRVAMAHNGNIVNSEQLSAHYGIKTHINSDLDLLQHAYLSFRDQGFVPAVQEIMDRFNGAYAVVGLEEDGSLFAFRDPHALRPLFYCETDDFFAVASETAALSPLGAKCVELGPAEAIRLSSLKDGCKLERHTLHSARNPSEQKRFCMFELVYFSSPQSELADTSVYRLRFNLGVALGRLIQRDLPVELVPRDLFDYVVPVPETSRTAAIAVAETLAVPYREFLVKNPYVPRTFILAKHDDRIKALRSKLSLIGPEIKGQRILLVDDSVVRGNTSSLMAARLREAGAKSVSLASTCPPIRHGCFYGIDFPDPEELVAAGRELSEIATKLGVDRLYYLNEAALKSALGTDQLCMACLNGEYPTFDSSFKSFLDSRRRDRGSAQRGGSS